MQELLMFGFGLLVGAFLGWLLHSTLFNLKNLTQSFFPGSTLSSQQKRELFHLFHSVWTKAVGTKDYNKAEWRELSALLSQVGLLDNP